MTVVSLPRGSIGYVEQGPVGAGRLPIIFLHGVGSDKSVWRPQLDHFSGDRRAVAFDYPGYGDSAPREGVGRDGFAQAIVEAMDAIGLDRVHVCGLSLGGVIAIALQRGAVERFASLIVADSFARHPEGQAIYDRSVTASTTMTMRALAEARAPALLGSTASDALRHDVIETMAAIDPAAYRQDADAVWLADQSARAAGIRVPTLVLCGEEDRITPPNLSEELAALIPRAKLAMIRSAGHLANIEQPGAFNSAIDEFLSNLDEYS